MTIWNGGQPLRVLLGLILALVGGEVAWAAGGAHVVDDAAVETPGTCHLEVWATRFGPDRGLVNVSPACTRAAWPRLELGAGLVHVEDGVDDTMIGPAAKLNLRSVERGWGLGIGASGGWSLKTGQLETAGVNAPLTLEATERMRVNLNAGWLYSRASRHPHTAFVGAQAEFQLSRSVVFMTEVFGRDRGRPGGQFGLRWTPVGGAFDLDLLAGRRIDGTSPSAVTIGLTWRK